MVVAPPIGLVIPFLPDDYTIIRINGIPYYYANDVYYIHSADGYVVTAPPTSQPEQTPSVANRLYIYPRKNQTKAQQADDRYACHRWAVKQTGYDPTMPNGKLTESEKKQKHSEYNRAISACLDARGYTVK